MARSKLERSLDAANAAVRRLQREGASSAAVQAAIRKADKARAALYRHRDQMERR